MNTIKLILGLITVALLLVSCNESKRKENTPKQVKHKELTAKEILGNPNYLAISYGGYRKTSRDIQPTIAQLKEDMKILQAMNIKVLRTYNVQLAQASNLMKAIRELKKEDSNFEMYVMLGAWIDCKNAWTNHQPDHNVESEQNAGEIARAVALANKYPDIIKIIAVGNEAMIRWAESYYVQPWVILKWINHLQDLKKEGKLPKDLWITCSDDYASWGGGDPSYRTEDLEKIVKAVDYVSMHTYAYHNSHYNPDFWYVPEAEESLSGSDKIENAMKRSLNFSKKQYNDVAAYIKSLGVNKPIHIGETGWASVSNGHYGPTGSRATDEYKQALYYKHMREWTNANNISCFYFEAFNEPWKDAHNKKGSENHFGLFTVDGKAKFALWDLVDNGTFKNLTRDRKPITKTYEGNKDSLLLEVQVPPAKSKVAVNH